jgi:hypothetical protein
LRAALIALLGVVAITGAGCGGSGKSAATTTVTTVTTVAATPTDATGTWSVTTHGRFHYPPVVVDNFMRSCTRTGKAREAYCSCSLDKLSDKVSVPDFNRIGISGGKVPPRIQRVIRQAALACADKL